MLVFINFKLKFIMAGRAELHHKESSHNIRRGFINYRPLLVRHRCVLGAQARLGGVGVIALWYYSCNWLYGRVPSLSSRLLYIVCRL